MFLVNKRLDEWVTEESLDTRKVHFPRRDGGSNTEVSTPKKIQIGGGGQSVSRYLKILTINYHYEEDHKIFSLKLILKNKFLKIIFDF